MTRAVAGGLALALLAGCVTVDESSIGPAPTSYRQAAADHLRKTLFDPYSVRDAEIASPRPGNIHVEGTLTHASGWAVCWRANAKNRYGAYVGLKENILIFREGAIVAATSDPEPFHYDLRTCRGARYEPFIELERVTAGPSPRPR